MGVRIVGSVQLTRMTSNSITFFRLFIDLISFGDNILHFAMACGWVGGGGVVE